MLATSLQPSAPATAAGRMILPQQNAVVQDFASLLPIMVPDAEDMAAAPPETDSLPVRATIIDIAGVAASATRAPDKVVMPEMAAQLVATTDAQPTTAITAPIAQPEATVSEATAPVALPQKLTMDTAPSDVRGTAVPATSDKAPEATDLKTVATAPVALTPTTVPVIAAAAQSVVKAPAPQKNSAKAAVPVMASALASSDIAKQAGDKTQTMRSNVTGQTLTTDPKAARTTRDAGNSSPLPSFADLSAKLQLTQVEGGPTMFSTSSNLLQAASAPLSAAPLAQPKFDGTLDMSQSSLWLDQLANDIAATLDKKGDLRFRLMPAQLGEMTVEMRVGDNGMALRMETRTEDASRIMTAHQSHLNDELRRQGIHVASTDISYAGNSNGQRGQDQRARNPDYPFWTNETGTANDDQDSSTHTPARRGRFA
jgi:flagellar hook-length control protein FliK